MNGHVFHNPGAMEASRLRPGQTQHAAARTGTLRRGDAGYATFTVAMCYNITNNIDVKGWLGSRVGSVLAQ